MNKTPYDDWLTNLLTLVERIIEQFIRFINRKLTKHEVKLITDMATKHVKNIKIADAQPRAFGGCNYTYVKIDFLSEESAKLFELCLKNVETTKDLSNLDFKEGYAYVRGLKYVGAMFQLGDAKKTRKFLENTDGVVDNQFKLSIVEDKDEYKDSPRELKIIF